MDDKHSGEERERQAEEKKEQSIYNHDSKQKSQAEEPKVAQNPNSDSIKNNNIVPPRNPNRKLTTINMERSIARMLEEHREVIRRAMR